jgi:predicted nucleotidyltransferase
MHSSRAPAPALLQKKTMEPHHTDSIRNLVSAFEKDATVLALILGGSLAHGFARPDSDIDVSIMVDAAEYGRRKAGNRMHYNNRTLCTYDGYIDGKYMDVEFLKQVAERGSDPIRYAYVGSRILVSRIEGLDTLLAAIVRYPVGQKQERIQRFAAQLLAWRWYYREGVRQQSSYLIILSIQKLILFGCRIVLAENERFFPYHKWMLRVLQSAARQPEGMSEDIQMLLTDHSWEKVNAYCLRLLAFAGIDHDEANAGWPTRFMKDTELSWVTQEPCIDDL